MPAPTAMLYLEDTYLLAERAAVLSVTTLEDGATDIALDRTILYPQGGGQPCDHGSIATDTGTLAVERVGLDPDGIIHHIGTLTGTISPGQTAELRVDAERRILNARNHSAGHLIDVAVSALGLPGLRPTK